MPGSSLISSIMEAELVMNGKRANERTIALEWKIKDELQMNYINLESEWRPSGKVIHYKLFRTQFDPIGKSIQDNIILFEDGFREFLISIQVFIHSGLIPSDSAEAFQINTMELVNSPSATTSQEGSSPEAYLTATNDIRVLIKNSVIYNISTNI